MERFFKGLRHIFSLWALYGRSLAKWLLLSALTGLGCGALGSAFHLGVEWATALRMSRPWVLYSLPLAGLAVTALYRLLRCEGQSTDSIIDQVQSGRGLSLRLLPAIFLSTLITHLAGGSAGREGAALQMGGSLGYSAGRLLRFDDKDLRTATMAGMAAFFSALFGTPLAAAVFAMGVISVGLVYHAAFFPCLLSSLCAYGLSRLLGVVPTRFAVAAPALTPLTLLQAAALSCLCAFLSVFFCAAIHGAEHGMKRLFKDPWLRALAGGAALLVLSLVFSGGTYNGAGMAQIRLAVEEGRALPWDFALKLLFTALTLSAGFKGGEVVPSFFVGAAFGCAAGPLLGLPAGFAAALGLVTVFCGAVNCPLASIFLALELFGDGGLLYFALGCALSYVLSGYSGLYSSQRILYDKLKAQFIDVHANAYEEGRSTEALRRFGGEEH